MKYCSILSEDTQVSECVWAGELGVDGMSPSVSRGEIRRQNNLRPLPLCTRSVIPSFCWYIMPWFGFSGQALTPQFSTRMIKEEMKNVYKGYFWDTFLRQMYIRDIFVLLGEIWYYCRNLDNQHHCASSNHLFVLSSNNLLPSNFQLIFKNR